MHTRRSDWWCSCRRCRRCRKGQRDWRCCLGNWYCRCRDWCRKRICIIMGYIIIIKERRKARRYACSRCCGLKGSYRGPNLGRVEEGVLIPDYIP
jgi:hypothetical protein